MTNPLLPPLSAGWIWSPEHGADEVNAHFEFSRKIDIPAASSGRIAITADTRYTLFVNGTRIADGPARGFPDKSYFDEVEVELQAGINEISVVVDSYGVDTFQYLRGKPGLWFVASIGEETILVSDETWRVRRALEYGQDVARISCQQGFEEHFDARIEPLGWVPATLVPQSDRCLQPRTTRLLSRTNREIHTLIRSERVQPLQQYWSLPIRRLLSPYPLGINLHGMAGAFATIVTSPFPTSIRLYYLGPIAGVFLNGTQVSTHRDQDLEWCDLDLLKGQNWLGIAVCTECDHIIDLALGSDAPEVVGWTNPLPNAVSPWASSGPLWTTNVETNCFLKPTGPNTAEDALYIPPLGSGFLKVKPELLQRAITLAREPQGKEFSSIRQEAPSNQDAYLAFRTDQIVGPGFAQMSVDEANTRLLFDLGEMTIGYIDLEIEAPSGTIVDGYQFEHLEGSEIQYLEHGGISYRNSFRFIAKDGINRFQSRQRRGFRYVQLTFRRAPVRILILRVVEATYIPEMVGTFESSDEQLSRIFQVSQRTLLLCMEDTYTDCPSYEQTFWLGDARNEMLTAQYSFNASDLTEHCLTLASHSMEKVPLVASQCPSGWDLVIPTFSFLWSIAVWESYWHTADEDSLRGIYPALRRNLTTATRYCTDDGLFSSPTWNFFDWTGIDQEQKTVLHNSMLLTAALEAGASAAKCLGEKQDEEMFLEEKSRLFHAINLAWNDQQQSYSDAKLSDGLYSQKTSQHTSFLALLYDLVPQEHYASALDNCLNPPDGIARVGSPNAMFFLLEALVKADRAPDVLSIVRDLWGRMLDKGATTFWEMMNPEGSKFPTRSHCHGWASSPAYLLPQLFFGIDRIEAGWRRVVLRPRLLGLSSVKAEICTPLGVLALEMYRGPDGKPILTFHCPNTMLVTIDHDGQDG